MDEDEVREVFNQFDRDRSGQINLRELAKLLEALGADPDDDMVGAAMKKLDKDGSGQLTWDEFIPWYRALD